MQNQDRIAFGLGALAGTAIGTWLWQKTSLVSESCVLTAGATTLSVAAIARIALNSRPAHGPERQTPWPVPAAPDGPQASSSQPTTAVNLICQTAQIPRPHPPRPPATSHRSAVGEAPSQPANTRRPTVPYHPPPPSSFEHQPHTPLTQLHAIRAPQTGPTSRPNGGPPATSHRSAVGEAPSQPANTRRPTVPYHPPPPSSFEHQPHTPLTQLHAIRAPQTGPTSRPNGGPPATTARQAPQQRHTQSTSTSFSPQPVGSAGHAPKQEAPRASGYSNVLPFFNPIATEPAQNIGLTPMTVSEVPPIQTFSYSSPEVTSRTIPWSTTLSPKSIPGVCTYTDWVYYRRFCEPEIIDCIRQNSTAIQRLQAAFPSIHIGDIVERHSSWNRTIIRPEALVTFSCTHQLFQAISRACLRDPQLRTLMPLLNKGPTRSRASTAGARCYINPNRSELQPCLTFDETVKQLERDSIAQLQCDADTTAWIPKQPGRECATPQEALMALIAAHPGVCIGEAHTHQDPKRLLMENVAALKAAGVEFLFLEHVFYDHHQPLLDAYFQHPEQGMAPQLEEYLKGIVRNHEALGDYSFVALVEAMVGAGIRPIAIDTSVSYNAGYTQGVGSSGPKRMAPMNLVGSRIMKYFLAQSPNAKYVALVGNAHASRYRTTRGYPQGEGCEIRGLAELMDCPNICYLEAKGSITQSVQFCLSDYSIPEDKEAIKHIDCVFWL